MGARTMATTSTVNRTGMDTLTDACVTALTHDSQTTCGTTCRGLFRHLSIHRYKSHEKTDRASPLELCRVRPNRKDNRGMASCRREMGACPARDQSEA